MAISVNRDRSTAPVQPKGRTAAAGGGIIVPGVDTPLVRVSGSGSIRRRIIAVIQGPPKSGKTDLALSCKGPVLIMDLDQGAEGVGDGYFDQKEIMKPDYPPVTIYPDDSVDTIATKANGLWMPFSRDLLAHLGSGRWGTVVVDTGSDMWWLLRLARFGKLEQIPSNSYGGLNFEMQSFFTAAAASPSTSLVFIHREKDEYQETTSRTGKTISTPTGRMKRDGWNQAGYKAQVVLKTRYEDGAEGRKFFVSVIDSRFSPAMIGMEFECGADRMVMPTICSMLVNGTSPEEWQ